MKNNIYPINHPPQPIRILILEDEPLDAEPSTRELIPDGIRPVGMDIIQRVIDWSEVCPQKIII